MSPNKILRETPGLLRVSLCNFFVSQSFTEKSRSFTEKIMITTKFGMSQ